MNIFYGGAIQGLGGSGSERINTNAELIHHIKLLGHHVLTEHTALPTHKERLAFLERTLGPFPKSGIERKIAVRNKMIECVEGDIGAAIFELSHPSLGTGNELAHAYLRPRMGLEEIPVLALYQKNYWSSGLSTMIKGINKEEVACFTLYEYSSVEDAKDFLGNFLGAK